MKTLEGKTLSAEILSRLPARCEAVKAKRGFSPSLAIVNFYPDSPSGVYARRKMASCAKIGINAKLFSPDPESQKPAHSFLFNLFSKPPSSQVNSITSAR